MDFYKANYHTHSLYCDGKCTLAEHISEAERLKLNQLGFSSHAPVPFENTFAISEEDLPKYCAEIDSLQASTGVILLKSLECDFVPGLTRDFEHWQSEHHLDYIIGGVHLVKPHDGDELWFIDGSKREIYDKGLRDLFDNNIKKAVTAFWEQTFEMLETQKMDIIAHVDKIKMHNADRFFTEDEHWYRILTEKALQLIKKHDVIMEINTRGLYKKRCNSFYPSVEMMQKARKMDIPVVISSDAHNAAELSMFTDEAAETLAQCGFDHTARFDVSGSKFVY